MFQRLETQFQNWLNSRIERRGFRDRGSVVSSIHAIGLSPGRWRFLKPLCFDLKASAVVVFFFSVKALWRPDHFWAFLSVLTISIILSIASGFNNWLAGGRFLGKMVASDVSFPVELFSWTLLHSPAKERSPTRRHWSRGSGNSLKNLILAFTESRRALEHQVGL
jgi:hypothetical protein